MATGDIDPGTIVIPEFETKIAHAAAAANQDAVDALTEEYHTARKAACKTVAVKEKPITRRKPAKATTPTPKRTPVDTPTVNERQVTSTTPPAVGGGGNVG